ncbi:uncharacterized protein SCHCODRAFT_02083723 [Schizophyllum commune H4-8]|uniref:uncharacterized protein n=1 Tax=Schizophyllum commune (strain H4-8 / FGSC 9210) TaxID=578458 RepID=UPI002160E0D8|nr:uncharacterized protein SCHCODRAFT_02083723 [Schizophyllum commune H4-8]KAI5886870.1 hypothetical protein SCHCODRAFT_02083723 [Schizophyllum commune H4-8]
MEGGKELDSASPAVLPGSETAALGAGQQTSTNPSEDGLDSLFPPSHPAADVSVDDFPRRNVSPVRYTCSRPRYVIMLCTRMYPDSTSLDRRKTRIPTSSQCNAALATGPLPHATFSGLPLLRRGEQPSILERYPGPRLVSGLYILGPNSIRLIIRHLSRSSDTRQPSAVATDRAPLTTRLCHRLSADLTN